MRTLITVAAALAMLVGSQAMGAYTVEYQLLLGGNNHAADYHSGAFVAYEGGSNADGAVFDLGANPNLIINWAVKVAVTGLDDQNNVAAGAANLVFDLELRDADGALVAVGFGSPTTAGFFSNINDGSTDDGVTNPIEAAAFATAFDVDSNGAGINGGRLWDRISSGGPFLDFYTYPSTNGHPAASTAAAGTLVGMGAGYKELTYGGVDSTAPDGHRVGVGIVTPGGLCTMGLGDPVLFEGQLNPKGLANGTYVLVLTAGTGNNVVPADTEQFPICNPGISGGKFAVAAATTPDTITFTIAGPQDPPCVAPVMTAAKSVKAQGAASYNIDLFPGKKTEGRLGGPTTVVVTFDRDIQLATGTAADVAVTSGTVSTVSATGAELTVTMSGATNKTAVTMSFPGVATSNAACTGTAVTASTLCMGVLFGDFNGDSGVNVSDLILVRNNLNKAITATTFMADVNIDGLVNVSDLILVRNNLNAAIPLASRCP